MGAEGTLAGKALLEDTNPSQALVLLGPAKLRGQPTVTVCTSSDIFKGTASLMLLLKMKDISFRAGRGSYKAKKLLCTPGRSYHGCWPPATPA